MQVNASVSREEEGDKYKQIILILLEIVETFESADPVVRQRETDLLYYFFAQTTNNNELILEKCVRMLEILMPDNSERIDYIADLVSQLTTENIGYMTSHVSDFIDGIPNPDLKLELIHWRFIMDEHRDNEQKAIDEGEYEQAARLHQGLLTSYGKFVERIKQLARDVKLQEISEANVIECIQQLTNGELPSHALIGAMQICFFVLNSKKVRKVTQSMFKVFLVSVFIIVKTLAVFLYSSFTN